MKQFLTIKFLYLTIFAYLCFLILLFFSILLSSLIRGHQQMMKTMHLLECRCKMPNANIKQLFLLETRRRLSVTSLVLQNKKLLFINHTHTLGSSLASHVWYNLLARNILASCTLPGKPAETSKNVKFEPTTACEFMVHFCFLKK